MAFHVVARTDELWEGELRSVLVGGRRVVLVRKGDDVAAFEDRCAHLGVPVSGGRLTGGVITCGAHHWQYDAATGCGVNPKSAALKRLPARVRDGQIEVEVDGST